MSEEERKSIDLRKWADDHLAEIERRRKALTAAIPLDTFLEERLELAPSASGDHLIAPCPFHGDDRPSLYVVPSKGFYHCFACGAHGDVVSADSNLRGLHESLSLKHLEDRLASGESPIKLQDPPTDLERQDMLRKLDIYREGE